MEKSPPRSSCLKERKKERGGGSPVLANINPIVSVPAVEATQKALCRLWSYCLSPGELLRPSDVEFLGHENIVTFCQIFPV